MKRFLLCTDLDRTLIPNGPQPESPIASKRFGQLVKREEVSLAYVTGRHRALVEQAIMEYDLPQPDFVIADVGTTIYRVAPSGWRQLDEWDEQIAPDWHGVIHEELYRRLRVFPALRLQEEDKQNRHKLSFYVALVSDTQGLIDELTALLQHAGIKANLIWSIDELGGMGLLDIIPVSANKLHAIRFLMQQNDFHHANTIFAGDSGNDMDVLLSPVLSVLVANASAEVREQAVNAHEKTLYIARGGYLGMNGNYSAGILEGVAHYLPEVDTWLREMNRT